MEDDTENRRTLGGTELTPKAKGKQKPSRFLVSPRASFVPSDYSQRRGRAPRVRGTRGYKFSAANHLLPHHPQPVGKCSPRTSSQISVTNWELTDSHISLGKKASLNMPAGSISPQQSDKELGQKSCRVWWPDHPKIPQLTALNCL